jgi:hypothetical protein
MPEKIEPLEKWTDEQLTERIAELREEIRRLNAVQQAEDIIATEHLERHERSMARFRADARPHQIAERRQTINCLRAILQARGFDLNRIDKPLGAR